MAGGPVNQALLQSFYQNAGDVYDDNDTEGAFGVLANQIDANWFSQSATQQQVNNLINNGTLIANQSDFYRQGIINANFDIWQRGTSFTPSTTSYTADRWVTNIDGAGGNVTVSQGLFGSGFTAIPNNPQFFLSHTINTIGTTTRVGTRQRIENVNLFANMQVSFSFWVRSSRNGVTVRRDILTQNFGGGGSSSVAITSGLSTTLATNVWTQITAVVTLPSTLGKTQGTNSFLEFEIRFSSIQAGDILDVAQVQFNAGPNLFPFKPKFVGDTLLQCQRYCLAYIDGSSTFAVGTGSASATTRAQIYVPFTPMRAQPTLVATPSDWAVTDGVTATALTAISLNGGGSNAQMANLLCDVAAGLTQFRPYALIANNSANRLMIFDAEL